MSDRDADEFLDAHGIPRDKQAVCDFIVQVIRAATNGSVMDTFDCLLAFVAGTIVHISTRYGEDLELLINAADGGIRIKVANLLNQKQLH